MSRIIFPLDVIVDMINDERRASRNIEFRKKKKPCLKRRVNGSSNLRGQHIKNILSKKKKRNVFDILNTIYTGKLRDIINYVRENCSYRLRLDRT